MELWSNGMVEVRDYEDWDVRSICALTPYSHTSTLHLLDFQEKTQ